MKDSLAELYDISKLSVELDGWMTSNGYKKYCSEISKEAQEIIGALENEDTDNLKEELGDVFMDLMAACLLAEKEGKFSSKEVVEGAISKIRRRRPYLEKGQKVTEEESVKIWMEAKEKEKKRKG